MPQAEYVFHSDPGHGWLAVKRAELKRLGILSQVSMFSYEHGITVYLEEDCDASLFLKAKEERGEPVKIRQSNSNSYSRIRNYHSFYTRNRLMNNCNTPY